LAIDRAKGRYICFLDCDDYLTQDSLKLRVELLSLSKVVVVFGPYYRLENDAFLNPVPAKETVSFDDMLRRNMIGNLTGMYDSGLIGKVFQKDIRHEDYLMWCDILKLSNCAISTGSDYLGVYRVSSKSLSGAYKFVLGSSLSGDSININAGTNSFCVASTNISYSSLCLFISLS
jgi:glycosyltransferase involved in cell wall biosynthesis